MPIRLVFKFRDDLNLPLNKKLLKLLEVPFGYSKVLKHTKRNSLPENLSASTKTNLDALIKLLSRINSKIGARPLYLFRYSPINLFNALQIKVDEINNKKKNPALYQMPSFYHCFEYMIPEDWPVDMLDYLIDGFEGFIPIQRNIKSSGVPPSNTLSPIEEEFKDDAYLLDFAYLTDDGIEAEAGSLRHVIENGGGNQAYLQDMGITDSTGARTQQEITERPDQWIAILELHGWNIPHPEFDEAITRRQVEVLTQYSAGSTESVILRNILVNQTNDFGTHGNKTLGILLSKDNSRRGLDCRGIAPDAQVVLSSAIMAIPANESSIGRASQISKENAFGFVLQYFLSKPPGQIILLEYSTSTNDPIIIESAFDYIITLASFLGHIVIIPAGNGSKHIKTLTPTLKRSTGKVLTYWKNEFSQIRPAYPALYLLVGASSLGEERMKVFDFSNWGELIHIYAQGEMVLTTTVSDEGLYDTMGFTSAASAIVAGVAALLQAYAISELSRPIWPEEMKAALLSVNDENTFVFKKINGQDVKVGVIPNVEAAMQYIRNLPNRI